MLGTFASIDAIIMGGTENEGLFRQAAIAWRNRQKLGHTAIITAPGGWTLTLLLVFAISAVLAFLHLNEYARKETLRGFVDDGGDVKRIFSNRTGRITRLAVNEGQKVKLGDVLAVVRTRGNSGPQEREYQLQIASLREQIELLDSTRKTERERIETTIGALTGSLDNRRKISDLQAQKVKRLSKVVEVSRPLFRSGHLSRLEWDNLRARLSDERQRAETLIDDLGKLRQQYRESQIRLEALPLSFRKRRLVLEEKLSALRLARARLLREQKAYLTAPVAGRVRTLFHHQGDQVMPGRPVMVLTSDRSRLRVTLLVPTASIRFVNDGQIVSLRSDAWPTDRPDRLPGTIVHSSNHVVMPRETDLPIPVRTPVYLVRVEVDEPLPGLALQPGMPLRANIPLESMTLLEWIFMPLTHRGHG